MTFSSRLCLSRLLVTGSKSRTSAATGSRSGSLMSSVQVLRLWLKTTSQLAWVSSRRQLFRRLLPSPRVLRRRREGVRGVVCSCLCPDTITIRFTMQSVHRGSEITKVKGDCASYILLGSFSLPQTGHWRCLGSHMISQGDSGRLGLQNRTLCLLLRQRSLVRPGH